MDSLIFDTTFLIDFQRERKTGAGRAHEFLRQNPDLFALLPVVAWAEFAEGFASHSDPIFLSVVSSFEILAVTVQVAAIYAALARKLREGGNLICTNDLWIASIALNRKCPLVTRNVEHFARIPRLHLRSY